MRAMHEIGEEINSICAKIGHLSDVYEAALMPMLITWVRRGVMQRSN
jgi:hypothetical protein